MAPLVFPMARAARRLFRSFWQAQDMRMRLGEVLVARGVVTRRQLREALDLQTDRYFRLHRSEPLGRLVVEKGFASETEVLDAIRDHYRIPAVALDQDLGELVRLRREIHAQSPVRLPLWFQFTAGVTALVLLAWLSAAALVDRDARGRAARSLDLAAIPPIPAQGFGDGETWSQLLYRAGFPQPRLAQEMATATFPSVKEFLKALQATGATNPRPGSFSPRLLQALMAAYETDYGRGGAVPVSYEMIWAVADKS